MYADDLVLMREICVGLRNKFLNGRRLMRARDLKLSLGKQR